MSTSQDLENESLVVCTNSQGTRIRATLMRMTRYLVTFEVYNPYSILQLSEVLGEFEILINSRKVYSGRAVVSNMVNTGLVLVCEASLDEESWLDVEMLSPSNQVSGLADEFDRLIKDWQKFDLISPQMKVIIADMENLLTDLRRWTEQLEIAVRSSPPPTRVQSELEIISRINGLVEPIVDELFKKFEILGSTVSEEANSIHRAYCRRQLHPLVLCSPFVHRTYDKPLGYAGDFEMVNMILRNPVEGASIFAKVVNSAFLATAPAEAHRNRIKYLTKALSAETRRCAKAGHGTRIFNLGCGPAMEVREFLTNDDLCERANFALLDFNKETIDQTGSELSELKAKLRRSTPVRMIQRSVNQILREGAKIGNDGENEVLYDVVYCAGLFDYLSDRVCARLLETFYNMVAPGGVVIATNVDSSNPCKKVMEFVMEWHLIYRDEEGFLELAPKDAPRDGVRVLKDETGVNIFLEIRKPG
ncbi:class I SAM-dependent methyltransferase [Pelagicoccus mobilis]|uniref:Class I SAM-dependent methyltransferase n=1 Tax=Pelagicoccus mobilis TaxID=415221 RepID=A0A934S2R8_9BACT|nr:class I SAM-dependent methyltransferase [Pelagicoccus mobilis]MBK1879586.1 class I SAM-dependent methyltransferase [Pelagicoccus mobilis]